MDKPETSIDKTLRELGIPEEIISKVITVTNDEPTAIELALQYTEQYNTEKQAVNQITDNKQEEQDYSNELKMVI